MIFVLIVLLWWAAAYFQWASSLLLPNPVDVAMCLSNHYGVLVYHAVVSMMPLVLGVMIAIVLGVVQATFVHVKEYSQQGRGISRLIHIFQGLPSFVVMPILVIWFGHSLWSKAIMVGLWSFFSVYASLLSGYKTLPVAYLNMSQVYHIAPWQRIRHIDFYHALPSLMAGIKIALTHAPLTVLAAEWFGAHAGLGYLLMVYYAQLDMPMVFTVVFVIMAIILALNALWRRAYEKLVFWI